MRRTHFSFLPSYPALTSAASLAVFLLVGIPAMSEPLPTEDGYRGIWYSNQPSDDEYRYKYSGGLGTYPQQHHPLAHYCKEVDKTFFCYGGSDPETGSLLHMISYFDHRTGTVPRPTKLLDKKTKDAHDNPVLQIDDDGHLWVFSNAHGTSRPSYIHRSVKPYSIDEFELIRETNFSYSQPWWVPDRGFLFLHTLYSKGRGLFWSTSPDGREWAEEKSLAHIEMGHYQVSARQGSKVGTLFNYHPKPIGLNARTNLYYLETEDLGTTWKTVDGRVVSTPILDATSPCLVRDYKSEGLLVYLKSVTFDPEGRPVLLYITTPGFESGPTNDPRHWRTAAWTGSEWRFGEVAPADHNYDYGPLTLGEDGIWRLYAPTEPGPQPYGTGGEMAMWISEDSGETWTKTKDLTRGSEFNHTYARCPENAHPDFYVFWADGHAREPSESRLYFTDQEGSTVWRLPVPMEGDEAKPEVWRKP